MRGGGGRGAARGVWTVARLQRIGNWGRADEALGRQWEEVGLAALAGQLDAPRLTALGEYVPRAVVALADDEALRREIHATGLPNPDAALLGAAVPQVQAHLAAVEQAAGLAVATLEYVDGLFFAPEHPENRAFLASEANAHAESPLTLADVVLCP